MCNRYNKIQNIKNISANVKILGRDAIFINFLNSFPLDSFNSLTNVKLFLIFSIQFVINVNTLTRSPGYIFVLILMNSGVFGVAWGTTGFFSVSGVQTDAVQFPGKMCSGSICVGWVYSLGWLGGVLGRPRRPLASGARTHDATVALCAPTMPTPH